MTFELNFTSCQLKRINHGPLDFFIFDRTVQIIFKRFTDSTNVVVKLFAVTSLPAPVFIRIPVLLRHHASDVIDDRDYLNPGWERNICI
jgi:hypothetical protein